MVDLPESGTYTFSLTSNDGSALYIGGKQIVNNDGCHYSTEKEGSAYLEAGRQSLAVGYFHKYVRFTFLGFDWVNSLIC